MPKTTSRQVVETVALSEAAAASAKASGRMLVQFITPGWGSSGYYSSEVLESAAADKVIPAGTHMYADHPTATENLERPIRSIKDLVAVTTSDATIAEDGGLVGEVQVVPGWQPFIETVAESIGVSIRGQAAAYFGEAEGRPGDIIESLDAPVMSVDFVTRAGRGGKVLQLLESAAATSRAVDHGVEEATVNDVRDALANTLRDAYGGDKTYVWIRDFDPSTVWFEIESEGDNGIYAQAYAGDGTTLTGDRSEVRIQTSYVPVNDGTATEASLPIPAGRTTIRTEESKEDTMGNITIEESEHTRLIEEAGRVTVLESERDTAIRERDLARAEVAARGIIAAQEGVSFSELEVRGLLAQLPLTEAGVLDATAFTTTVESEVTRARESHARALEESGVGRVSSFGGTTPSSTGTEVSEADLDTTIARAFGREVKGA